MCAPPHPPESAIDNEELTSELAYGWMVQHKKKKKRTDILNLKTRHCGAGPENRASERIPSSFFFLRVGKNIKLHKHFIKP